MRKQVDVIGLDKEVLELAKKQMFIISDDALGTLRVSTALLQNLTSYYEVISPNEDDEENLSKIEYVHKQYYDNWHNEDWIERCVTYIYEEDIEKICDLLELNYKMFLELYYKYYVYN